MQFNLGIDLPMLLEQKQALLRAISTATPETERDLLYGILHLLDAIHDVMDPPTGEEDD